MNRERAILLVVVLFAMTVRIAAFMVWPDLPKQDTDGYLGIAQNLVDGNGYANGATGKATAFRPPLFPLLIALCSYVPFGFRILQVVAGTISVWLTGIIATRLRLRLPWLPAAMVACDPILIAYTPRAMTEVVSALTLAMLLWVLVPTTRKPTRLRAFVVGCVFGVAVLCRPTVLALVPFAGVVFLISMREFDRKDVFRWGVCAGVGFGVLVVPWTLRNMMNLKSPVFATTHGGYTLLLGNNPEFYDTVARGSWKTVWDSLPWQATLREELVSSDVNMEDEVAVDGWMYQRAKSNIRADPSGFGSACLVRLRRFWNFAPLVEQQSAIVMWGMRIFYAFVFAGLVATVFRQWHLETRWFFLVAVSMLLAFTLVHLFYWSNTRMRAPLTVPIAILSVRGWLGQLPSASKSVE